MLVKQKESKMQEFRELMQQLYCSEVPLRYWYSEAIIWMIDTLENQKAHNLDEALILYEEELNNRANIRRQMMKIIKKYLK